jgi:hypothetical protein
MHCDGTIENPFPNVLEALEYISKEDVLEKISQVSQIDIIMTAGENLITDRDIQQINRRRIEKNGFIEISIILEIDLKNTQSYFDSVLLRCDSRLTTLNLDTSNFVIKLPKNIEIANISFVDRSLPSNIQIGLFFLINPQSRVLIKNFSLTSTSRVLNTTRTPLAFFYIANTAVHSTLSILNANMTFSDDLIFSSLVAKIKPTVNIEISNLNMKANLVDAKFNRRIFDADGGNIILISSFLAISTSASHLPFVFVSSNGSLNAKIIDLNINCNLDSLSHERGLILKSGSFSYIHIIQTNFSLSSSSKTGPGSMILIDIIDNSYIYIQNYFLFNLQRITFNSNLFITFMSIRSTNKLLFSNMSLKDIFVWNFLLLSCES